MTSIKLAEAYRKMAEFTELFCKECSKRTGNPNRCCSTEYCNAAMGYAIEKSEAAQEMLNRKQQHQELPFLTNTGCIVPPHLRPMCSMHLCDINSLGVIKGNGLATMKYFALRDAIEEEEFRIAMAKGATCQPD